MKSSDAHLDACFERPAVRGEVAVVGLACTYPKARTAGQFWQNIVDGVDAIAEVSPTRWDPEVFYDPKPGVEDRVYCKRGGYLDNTFAFNPFRYGTMPRAIEGAEPDQFLVLRTVHEALDNAGYLERPLDGRRCAFILGRGNYLGVGLTSLLQRGMMAEQTVQILRALHPEYTEKQLAEIKNAMRGHVPAFGAETAPGLIPNITTGRAANRLDLMGPTFTIDAACASSLIATDLGVHDLLTGKHDLVLAGGVHVFSDVPFLQVFAAMGALSRTSMIRPFDAESDGTMAGEGVGVLVLKRLADAERDGDRIYAVIRGVGTSSDGRAKSVTAPRVEGEELALRRAYAMAGIEPTSVGLIEAHGTGTPVGDATEVEALHRVLGPRRTGPRTVALGSVKSMIGHTMPAAGVAGLIKTILALHHRVLPPSLHCRRPMEAIDGADSPLYVSTQTRPWVHGRSNAPRRAGVSAFGFGGVNAHVVLEEYRGPQRTAVAVPEKPWSAGPVQLHRQRPSELVVLEAGSRAALTETAARLDAYLEAAEGVTLAEVAAHCNRQLGEGAFRLALVAADLADLRAKLRRALERLADPACQRIQDSKGIYYLSETELRGARLAFLFPGEGAQYANMLADLCLHFPEMRARFDSADRAVTDTDRDPPSADLFPAPSAPADELAAAEQRLWQIERAVEAVMTADGAMFELLDRLGISPDMITGHSGGEWIASVAAGLFGVDDFLASMPRLDRMYRELNADTSIPSMVMLAVGAGRQAVEELAGELHRPVMIANDNCRHQVVVVTAPQDAETVIGQLRARQIFVERLPYDRGYHTPAFEAICRPLRDYFAQLGIRAARTPLYSCTTAEKYPADHATILDILTHTFVRPVLFRQTIERMYADGARIFVEVGPRTNLTAFTDDILRGRPHLAISTNHHRREGLTTLHHALAVLAALHVPMSLAPLYESRSLRELTGDAPLDRVLPETAQPGTMQVSLCYPHLEFPKSYRAPAAGQAKPDVPPVNGSSASPPPKQPAVNMRPSPPGPPLATTPRPAVAAAEADRRRDEAASPALAATTDLAARPVAITPRPSAPAPGSSAAAMLLGHMSVMEQAIEAQNRVMLAYLADGRRAGRATSRRTRWPNGVARLAGAGLPETPSAAVAAPPPPAAPPAAIAAPTIDPVDDPAVVAPPEAASDHAGDEAAILEIVSERTGYPADMLDLDLDLEADLGIDSIKRIEILGAIQRLGVLGQAAGAELDMEDAARLKTLREVLEHVRALRGGQPATDPAPNGPDAGRLSFAGEVVSFEAGRTITVRRRVALDRDLYINDHHFDPQISEWDPTRASLNVIPMTVSIEMLAEVAALLEPHRKLVTLRGAQVDRWIEVEAHAPAPLLQLVATREGEEIRANLHVVDEGRDRIGPALARATFLFAEAFPAPPPVAAFVPRNARTPSHTAAQMYALHRMFHGPRFQGVVGLDQIGEDGLVATLEVLRTDDLFADRSAAAFLLDPFLLDAAGQLVGYWPVEYLPEGYVLFPIRLQELTRYQEEPPVGSRITCHLRVRHLAHRELHADLDLLGPNGRLWMRLSGWQDWRFHWPRDFYDFWRFPDQFVAGRELRLPLPPGLEDVEVRRMISEGELKSVLWEKLWAYLICSRRELARFMEFPISPRRTEWMAGRSAAKDAARVWLKKRLGRDLYPADVEITPDERGAPVVGGPCSSAVAELPHVSIAHKGVVGVAAASARPVGIDLEAIEPRDDAFAAAAFSGAERQLLAALPGDRNEWLTRAWAAKEAAGKAAGGGLEGGPQGLAIARIEPEKGLFVVQLRNSPGADRAPGSRRFFATTTRDADFVIALAAEDEHDHTGA